MRYVDPEFDLEFSDEDGVMDRMGVRTMMTKMTSRNPRGKVDEQNEEAAISGVLAH